jgi:hypothetical protein
MTQEKGKLQSYNQFIKEREIRGTLEITEKMRYQTFWGKYIPE